MQNLINELLNPTTDANGNIVPPSTAKRRAAEAIALLHKLATEDKAARGAREHYSLNGFSRS